MDARISYTLIAAILAIFASVKGEMTASDHQIDQQPQQMLLDDRVHVLEDELQRVKDHLSQIEALLDAWFSTAAVAADQQPPSTIVVNSPAVDGGWQDALQMVENNGVAGKRAAAAAGSRAFMGSRGKRKQPFYLGSRGKRAATMTTGGDGSDRIEQLLQQQGMTMRKRRAYFYGSRGKKQSYANGDNALFADDSDSAANVRMRPYSNKRFTFLGSRGKK